MKIVVALAALILVVAAGCSSASPLAELDLVLVDVTVLDGTGATPRPGPPVEIRDGRITAIRPTTGDDRGTLESPGRS